MASSAGTLTSNPGGADPLASHKCPLCLEVMVHPTYSPLMLVPCGHTFCSRCLEKYRRGAKGDRCPLCRTAIDNAVPNHSLRQVIEAAHGGAPEEEGGLSSDLERAIAGVDPETAKQIREYVSMYSMAEARCNVLEQEQHAAEEELAAVSNASKVDKQVAEYLASEEAQILQNIERLTKELEVVRYQLAERATSVADNDIKEADARQRVADIKQSIATIGRDTLKARTILSHLAPNLEL
eukprot:TRINITY_DN19438_c0_g1_i1.p1 TRINITY_DN19438_c0_g1~~TRINITY_DN19438_c0_g1_i1.p1  ORF type:complete len:239 (+),score=86.68 TRINITY_DN19438_c0_g1_i1:70-786(+)